MELTLDRRLSIGLQGIHGRPESTAGEWRPEAEKGRELVERIERLGFDSIWVGDHVAFAVPILDPLIQLAQAAAYSKRLTIGTCVYLLPLRHPGPVAKQVASLDLLSGGRMVFGVGAGGEFQSDFDASGIAMKERGGRLGESIEVLRKLWSGETVSHHGRYFAFEDIRLLPAPLQAGGPPIWCGGRSQAALERTGRMADGWVSYVVTAERYAQSLSVIDGAYAQAGRGLDRFATGHLLFARLDKDYERALDTASALLSARYAMDFRPAAEKYCALGTGEDVAAAIARFYEAGVRCLVVDLIGPHEERLEHIDAFASEVLPKLASYRES